MFFYLYIYSNNSATVTAVRGSGWSSLFNFESQKAKENKQVIVGVYVIGPWDTAGDFYELGDP